MVPPPCRRRPLPHRRHLVADRETGSILITPLPGLTKLKPGSASRPFPGLKPAIVTESGQPVEVGGGYLVQTRPWPSMLRTIYGDHDRYVATYCM